MPLSTLDDRPILCADDYAIGEEVSEAIEELAEAQHLSATSAIVTAPEWRSYGRRTAALRRHVALGLHLNFTEGRPLAPMPHYAPTGSFTGIARLCARSLSRNIDRDEIRSEALRQIERFAEVVGELPDFVDGHHHAHALPGVRDGALAAIAEAFSSRPVLVRDPSDSLLAILHRREGAAKALIVATLVSGFGAECARLGLATNAGFAGFTDSGLHGNYADALLRYFVHQGPRHLIMCHPGKAYATQQSDAAPDRRREEFEVIRRAHWLRDRIWHPTPPDAGIAALQLAEVRS